MIRVDACKISATKPRYDNRVGWRKALRRDVGALLEYAWNLSASLRSCRVHALVARCTERRTGQSVTSFYLGDRTNYGFICKRLFTDLQVVERYDGVGAPWASKWLKKYGSRADLLIVDLELLFCKMLRKEHFIRIPHWIRQKYRVPETWEGVLGSLRKNTKKTDLRKIRKYRLGYRITTAEQDFSDFYHRMHRPYLENRFHDLVIIEPEWKFMHQCRKGELMQITRDDQVLAGVLLHSLGGRLAYVWVGVKEDLDPGMDQGVFSALYYYTILYGYEKGCDEIDFLGTRPVLNDGLFRYKRKWGTYVEDSPIPRGDIMLRPVRFTEPVRAMFGENSFIVRDRDGLAGKILLDDGRTTLETVESLYSRFHTPGLCRLKLFSTNGFEEEAQRWVRDPRVLAELCDLSGSSDPARDFCRL